MKKTDGEHSAYPFFKMDEDKTIFCDSRDMQGLTKREYFANNAPVEIPSWFIHDKAKLSPAPTSYTLLFKEGNPIRKELQDYYDSEGLVAVVSNEAKEYIEKDEKYWEEKKAWEKQNTIDRYFQWRTYYADMLIQQLNKNNESTS